MRVAEYLAIKEAYHMATKLKRPKATKKETSTKKRAWREKARVDGKCLRCGSAKGTSPYKDSCYKCAKLKRDYQRRKRGTKKWVKGSRGRTPLVSDRHY